MLTIVILSLIIGAISSQEWRNLNNQGSYIPSRGIPRQASGGGWGNAGGHGIGNPQGVWGVADGVVGPRQGGWGENQGNFQGQNGWGGRQSEPLGQQGWRNGRSADVGLYRASINTHDRQGYNDNIPGAHLGYLGERSSRSEPRGFGNTHAYGQGNDGQGRNRNGVYAVWQ